MLNWEKKLGVGDTGSWKSLGSYYLISYQKQFLWIFLQKAIFLWFSLAIKGTQIKVVSIQTYLPWQYSTFWNDLFPSYSLLRALLWCDLVCCSLTVVVIKLLLSSTLHGILSHIFTVSITLLFIIIIVISNLLWYCQFLCHYIVTWSHLWLQIITNLLLLIVTLLLHHYYVIIMSSLCLYTIGKII